MPTATLLDAQEIEQQFADRAAMLELNTPVLPFDSICMDGQLHTVSYGSESLPFPTAKEDVSQRLSEMGRMWAHQGTLEFVDGQGKYHIARDVEANRKALKAAGFDTDRGHWTRFTNGTHPAGENEKKFKALMNTPQDAREQLEWAVRDGDLSKFTAAKEQLLASPATYPPGYEQDKAADISSWKHSFDNDRLVFHAFTSYESSPDRDAIVRALLPDKAVRSTAFDSNVLSAAIGSHQDVSDVIPDIIKAGNNPLDRDSRCTPAFLNIEANKNSSLEEWKLVSEATLRQEGLTDKEKKLLRAQVDYAGEGLAVTRNEYLRAVEQDTIYDYDRYNEANRRLSILGNVWEDAHKFTKESDTGLVPQQVQAFLEPMTDPRRAPKFLTAVDKWTGRLSDVDDVSREFASHVVLPQVILEHSRQTGVPVTDESLKALEEHHPDLLGRLTPVVKAHLFGDRSLDKVIGLSEAWHDPQVAFPDALKPIKASGQWHPLTEQKTHDVPTAPGVSLHVLTSDEELRHEGKVMGHCVGGGNYTTKGLKGESHILSVRKAGQDVPLSTIEASWNGKEFNVIQNQRPGNGQAPQEAQEAQEWFKAELESGRIKPSPQLGETEKSKRINARPQLLRSIGFEIEPQNIDAAFAEYALNSKRQGREYNPKTDKFDIISRRTEMITGGLDMPLKGNTAENSFVILGKDGTPRKTTVAFKHLSAAQWFEASGLREKAMAVTLQPDIDRALTERQAARDAELREQERQAALEQARLREQARKEAIAKSTPFHAEITPDSRTKLERLKDTMGKMVLGEMPQSVAQQAVSHQERLLRSRAKGGSPDTQNLST